MRSAKANSTTAAADSAYDMPGSEAAATKATTVETATKTTTTMEATTTEASSTTAVPGSPCCGTERREGDAN